MAKKGGGNGKKKIQPVKPKTGRRGGSKVKDAVRTIVAPEYMIGKKLTGKGGKSWAEKVRDGFLTGITLGFYKPKKGGR